MNLSRFEPIGVFIWGLLINLLIANGYLLPTQKELWVNGGLELISALGTGAMFTLYLHHSLSKHSQQDTNAVIQTIVDSINKSSGNGSAAIPMTNTRDSVIHVNIP